MLNLNQQKGFTLMESVIYIALFSIIITGTIVSAYELLRGSSAIDKKIVIQSEGNFVIRKIESALNGAQSIVLPSSGSGSVLRVIKSDGAQSDIQINGNFVEFRDGALNSFLPITTPNVILESLVFEKLEESGASPAGIKAVLTLNGTTFETTRYIRN